jgi:hypothetical protein
MSMRHSEQRDVRPFAGITISRLAKVRQRGVAMIEFALTAPVFLLLIFLIIDFSYLFWVNLTMQHAVREGVRFAVVGRTLADPNDPQGQTQLNHCDSAKEFIRRNAMGLYDKLNPTIAFNTVDASGNVVPVPSGSCWSAGQIIMVDATTEMPLLTPLVRPFFPDGTYVFSVSTTMKNEAFK